MSAIQNKARDRRCSPTPNLPSPTFPFDHQVFVGLLLHECKGLRLLTGFRDMLHRYLQQGAQYMVLSQCSLNKALEGVCRQITWAGGASVHSKYWKVAKFLANHPQYKLDVRPTHVYAPCNMPDVVRQSICPDIYTIPREPWMKTFRLHHDTRPTLQDPDMERLMNHQILEAIVHHQIAHRHVWRPGKTYHEFTFDLHSIFLALTFARRATSKAIDCSPSLASHVATIAVRYDIEDSRVQSMAFKGLRRWKNVDNDLVVEWTLKCIWGWKDTPRHHHLWHYERWIEEHNLQDMKATVEDGKFLLLMGVLNDAVFAHLPPEDTTATIVTMLFKIPMSKSMQHDYDAKRLLQALQQPRSAYMHIVFPQQSTIPVEAWIAKLCPEATRTPL